MTTRRYLSNKKTSQQTISISPSLKDWIRRYVSVMHKKNPEDERYKSVSSFYCTIMENVLKIFEKGKTLDDFDKLMDDEIREIYDTFSANLFIPYIEPSLKASRYDKIDFRSTTRYLMPLLRVVEKNMDPLSYESAKIMFDRVKNRYYSSGLTKDMKLDLYEKKKDKHYYGTVEHIGVYKNLHLLNCKMLAEAFGFIGVKVTNMAFSEDNLYYRMGIETDDLFFRKELIKNERIKLLEKNVNHIINYNRIINDETYHLWMKMAKDNDVIVNFKNEEAREKWIETIENDLRKFGTKEEILLKLLKYFEHLHWIRIENEEELSFRINLLKPKNEMEIEFILEHLSKYSKISEKNDVYYLGKVDL